MGKCLEKLPHSCGSSNGLQVFAEEDGSVNGWCYACSTFVENPYGDPLSVKEVESRSGFKAQSKEEDQEQIDFISTLGCMDIESRRLRKASLEYYGVKVGVSTQDGKTPAYVHFPYTKDGKVVRYKTRMLEKKKMWSVSVSKDVDMFGWQQAIESGARRLIITEGEFDAIALHRIIEMGTKEDYKDYKPAVVSLSNGASGAVKDISNHLERIRKTFKEICLCFDMDEPGQKAVEAVCKICPEAKVVELPRKDVNECLIAGLGKAVFKAVTFNAAKAKNTRLVWGFELHEKAKEKPKWGLSWPWPKMTELTRGIRFGETIYIAAGEKMGW